MFNLDSGLTNLNSVLTSGSNISLCKYIKAANNVIDFIGVGLSAEVADCMITRKEILRHIVIDNSDIVYHCGYGNPLALAKFKEAKIDVMAGKNIRMNILRIDDNAIVYSPTALSFEEDQNNLFNALLVKFDVVKEIFDKFEVTDDKNINEENPIQAGNIVATTLSEEDINKTVKEMEGTTKKLDFARILNTYRAKLQFVEFELKKFNVTSHSIKIPKELLKLSKGNKEAEAQLNATYSIFDKYSDYAQEAKEIVNIKDEIRKNFLINVKGYGTVMVLKLKPQFEEEIKKLDSAINRFKEKSVENRNKLIEDAKNSIMTICKPLVLRNPPIPLRAASSDDGEISDDVAERYILQKLDPAFEEIKKGYDSMEVTYRYKDVTLELLESDELWVAMEKSPYAYLFKDKQLLDRGLGISIKE